MFMKALDAMGKLDDPFFGNIPPDDTVKLVFNLSQGEDVRGPWNEAPEFDYVAHPEPMVACRQHRSILMTSVRPRPRWRRSRAPRRIDRSAI